MIGDGIHTVSDLVEIANSDPRRGIGHEKVLTRIKVDDAIDLLRKQGYGLDDVPAAEAFVKLAATGNMSTGGNSIDRTWEAHEENVEIAEEAAPASSGSTSPASTSSRRTSPNPCARPAARSSR